MRSRLAASILLLVLAACGSSSAASEHSSGASTTSSAPTGSGTAHSVACGPRSAKTLAASRQARVYSTGGQVYGCAIGGRHADRLGASARSIREDRVGPVVVAGLDAGYGLSSFGVDTVSAEVVVRNLATGHQIHAAPATETALPESFQSVAAIVIKADGAVAWIGQVSSIVSHRQSVEIRRVDRRGQSLLDSGPGIDTRSLRLHGSTLTWRKGFTRTASLD